MAKNQYISPEMIRTFLLDRSASDNFLLDEVEFDTPSLDLAMILAVDCYNKLLPILDEGYTVENFPHKMEFLLGVSGFLMRSKGLNMARNALQYSSSSGTAVDDLSSKSKFYLEMGGKFLDEFKEQSRIIKQNQNINDGFGHVGGPSRGAW